MASLENDVINKRIETVIAAYSQELINDEIRSEFLLKQCRYSYREWRKLRKLNEKMKSRHEHFMLFCRAPYQKIEKYYELFCSVEQEKVGLS